MSSPANAVLTSQRTARTLQEFARSGATIETAADVASLRADPPAVVTGEGVTVEDRVTRALQAYLRNHNR